MKNGEDYIGVCVTYFCHDGEGNFLFNKRSKNCRDEIGNWDCGGGAVEFGDTLENTLKKEINEEYCTDILDFEFLGYENVLRENNEKKTHLVAFDFKVRVNREKVKNGEPHKFDEIGWFKINNLPKPLHSCLPDCVERYKVKLEK